MSRNRLALFGQRLVRQRAKAHLSSGDIQIVTCATSNDEGKLIYNALLSVGGLLATLAVQLSGRAGTERIRVVPFPVARFCGWRATSYRFHIWKHAVRNSQYCCNIRAGLRSRLWLGLCRFPYSGIPLNQTLDPNNATQMAALQRGIITQEQGAGPESGILSQVNLGSTGSLSLH